jgi:hypothetical protein
MTARFYLLCAVLAFMLLAMLGHFLLFDRSAVLAKQRALVEVTGLDSPALSVAWFEPRLRRFEASLDPAYPELLPTDRLDFVYGELYGR